MSLYNKKLIWIQRLITIGNYFVLDFAVKMLPKEKKENANSL